MLVNFIILFKHFTILVPSWPRFEKGDFCTILKGRKTSNVSEKTINQNTSFTISFERTMYSTFIFVKTLAALSALWC